MLHTYRPVSALFAVRNHPDSVCACEHAGFVLYLMDVTFRSAQWMHTVQASPDSQVSDDATLATLAFRWSHVSSPVMPFALVACLVLLPFAPVTCPVLIAFALVPCPVLLPIAHRPQGMPCCAASIGKTCLLVLLCAHWAWLSVLPSAQGTLPSATGTTTCDPYMSTVPALHAFASNFVTRSRHLLHC